MVKLFSLCLLVFACSSCVFIIELPSNYKKNVGDIEFDPSTDDPYFVIGSKKVVQYYNFGKGVNFRGENIAIDKYIREN